MLLIITCPPISPVSTLHTVLNIYPVLCRIWIFEVTGTLGVLAEDKVVIATISSSAAFQAALPSDEPVIIPRKKN